MFGLGYSSGVDSQGAAYARGVLILNVIWWIVVAVLFRLAWLRKTVAYNFAFHIVLFAWLAWYALPYMGELP